MDHREKSRLARADDDSKEATGLRVRAARKVAGITQLELGEHGNIGKTAVTNVEAGRAYPNREILIYFYREHRIDVNFILLGAYNRLEGDVQDQIFAVLKNQNSEQGLSTD